MSVIVIAIPAQDHPRLHLHAHDGGDHERDLHAKTDRQRQEKMRQEDWTVVCSMFFAPAAAHCPLLLRSVTLFFRSFDSAALVVHGMLMLLFFSPADVGSRFPLHLDQRVEEWYDQKSDHPQSPATLHSWLSPPLLS